MQGKIEGPKVTPTKTHPGTSRGVRALTFTGCQSTGYGCHHVAALTMFSDGELKSGHTLQSNQGADWTLTGVFIGGEHSGVFLCTCIIACSQDMAAVAYVITLSFAQIISVRCHLWGFSYAANTMVL